MEAVEEVVIVGAGLSGVATALGLHRKGIKSLVLESSESLRASGFALTTWTNAWRALDALGVGDSLRRQSLRLEREIATSASSGAITSQQILTTRGKIGEHEVRCVRRNLLLEALARELPQGTIRFSSKVVSIEEDGNLKILHLVDGSILRAKVLVGCDGVNSLVAKCLGLNKPSFTGRNASRGFTVFPDGHGFRPRFHQYFGEGFRCGYLPCDDESIYWFFTWTPSPQDEEVEDATKMKNFILNKLKTSKAPEQMAQIVSNGEMGTVVSSPLRFRNPFELLTGNITDGHVCVTGDALHPMTPDLGQGGCSALEDGVTLARCLGEVILNGERIEGGLMKYAKERRWRSFDLIVRSYVLGFVQESSGWVMNFLRDKCLAGFLDGQYLKKADFDCGKI